MRNYEKLEKENRLIVLPVPVGTTVYEVIPPYIHFPDDYNRLYDMAKGGDPE